MSTPPIESSPSLTDLFEYDEYDSYVNPYAEINTSEHFDEGIPLSVELSESLSRQINNVPHNITSSATDNDTDDISEQFVKAPEIFLRLENDVVTAATSASTADANRKIKTECDRIGDSIESSGSDVSVVPTTIEIECDIVELHYENEFIDAYDADECDDVDQTMSMSQRLTTQFENENEQLLFEGIQKQYF